MNSDVQKRERLQQLFAGNEPDRPPVAFWHHFYPDGNGGQLARYTYQFYRQFDADFAKIMPDIPYTLPDNSIQRDIDWEYVAPIAMDSGNVAQYILAAEATRKLLGPDAPLLVTIFSPLAWLQYWVGLSNVADLERFPLAKVHRALSITAENLFNLSRKLLSVGVDGIYYSVWGSDLLSAEVYKEFGRPYDLMALEGARGAEFNILHVHGAQGLKLELYQDFPLKVVSWSSLDTGITLTQGKALLNGKIPMGGWSERGDHLLSENPTDLIADEAKAAKRELGNSLILAPGCSLPDNVSAATLRAMRTAAE